YHQV
ncbi:hypothetical protein D050_0764B, partial [Vibrio parahaemolyticus VPCR-2009]